MKYLEGPRLRTIGTSLQIMIAVGRPSVERTSYRPLIASCLGWISKSRLAAL